MYNLISKLNYLIVFSLLLFSSCNSVQEIRTTLPSDVNPSSCRISGAIIGIDDIVESTGSCSIKPCVATVKVNSVIKRGFSFNSTIIKYDTLKVKFEFTLSKTSQELFPNLNYILPGLKISDSFIADLEEVELVQSKNNGINVEYKIYNYDKID